MRLNGWAGENLLCSNSFLYVQLITEACYFVTIIALLSLALKKNWARLNYAEHVHQKDRENYISERFSRGIPDFERGRNDDYGKCRDAK